MTQEDRDRLVALQTAKKGLITQKEAAAEIGQSERHVRRLLKKLKGKGDAALMHRLRGRRWNRKIDEKVKQAAPSTWPTSTTFTQGGKLCADGWWKPSLQPGVFARIPLHQFASARPPLTPLVNFFDALPFGLPPKEQDPLPPTQIGRALQELDMIWIPAHSPQAKGRDYTIQFDEVRLDGSLAVRFRHSYLTVTECLARPKVEAARKPRKPAAPHKKSQWMSNFQLTSPEKIALSAIPPVPTVRAAKGNPGSATSQRRHSQIKPSPQNPPVKPDISTWR